MQLNKPQFKSLHLLLIILIAGGISIFAFAPFNHSYIMAVTILMLLYVIDNFAAYVSKKKLFAYGYFFGFTYFATQLYWAFYSLYKIIDTGLIISTLAYIFFVGFLALYMGLIVTVYHKYKTKFAIVNLAVFFPSVWVFFEWLRSWLFSGFPWCEVGYTQVNISFLKGFYPLGGSYLVSWIFLSMIGAFYFIIKNKILFITSRNISNIPPKRYTNLILFYFLAIIIGGDFLAKINYTKPYGKPISVALIQGNISQGVKWSSNNFLDIYKKEIALAHADIVIIPETAISSFSEYLPVGYLDGLVKTAKTNGANLIIGIPKFIDKQNNYVNSALLLTDPKQSYYAKYHLVPYGEYIPMKWLFGKVYSMINLPLVGFSSGGKEQSPLVVANQKLAFNICYENGFNTELTANAMQSTILANLSDMVWYGDTVAKDQHLQISQVRALENQRYFIQDTNTGLTAIITPNGMIQSKLAPFVKGTLTDMVQGRFGATPFEIVGNYPIIIICALFIFIFIGFRRFKK